MCFIVVHYVFAYVVLCRQSKKYKLCCLYHAKSTLSQPTCSCFYSIEYAEILLLSIDGMRVHCRLFPSLSNWHGRTASMAAVVSFLKGKVKHWKIPRKGF